MDTAFKMMEDNRFATLAIPPRCLMCNDHYTRPRKELCDSGAGGKRWFFCVFGVFFFFMLNVDFAVSFPIVGFLSTKDQGFCRFEHSCRFVRR